MADISEVTVIEKKEDGTIVTTTTYDIKDEIAREQLNAIPDGTYPDMTVGGVMSSDGSTDSTPYLYRESGGGVEVGAVEEDSIVGGTVAFNQLINYASASTRTTNGVTFTYDGSGKVTVNGTATAVADYSLNRVDYLDGHKYMMLGIPQSTGCSAFLFAENFTRPSIKAPQKSDYFTARIRVANGTTVSNAVFHLLLFDLTQMFGTSVADYIYSLEQSSTGAGVAFFRSLFPNDYYAYNAGELMHVSGVSEHVMVGKNIYPVKKNVTYTNAGVTINTDEDGVIHVSGTATNRVDYSLIEGYYGTGAGLLTLPAGTYTVSVDGIAGVSGVEIVFGGSWSAVTYKAFHGALWNPYTFTLSADGQTGYNFLRVPSGTTVNATFKIQFELGSTATSYEPYVKHSYPLDSSLTLRGIPKLSNGLYFDGDTYEADGTVTRKYGVVDLGTLIWSYDSTNSVFQTGLGIVKTGTDGTPIICSKYVGRPYGYNGSYSTEDKIIWVHSGSGTLRVRDSSYTDATSFKTAMSGVMLVYELATPTTESAEPYESIQKVSKYGTEEYVSTGIVPVGHVTKYPTDIVAKVNGLPSDFSALIAPTETGFKATRAYSVNQFIIVNNQLYRVTSAIASGATITVGANVAATTIADILTSLLNA